MRFEPSEEAMYRRMDQKERILYLIAAGGLVGPLVFLLGVINKNWYVAGGTVCFAVCFIAVLVWRYRALGQRIMPLTGCFLEVRQDCLLVRQPQQQERYEACRIFCPEIEQLVWSGMKEGFYIRFHDNGKSSVLLRGKQSGPIFHIRPFGYRKEEMESVYQAIKERLPASASVFEP